MNVKLRLLGVLLITAAALPAAAQDKIIVGNTGAGSPLQWPAYAGIAKGFFRAAGVELDMIPMPSSAAGMQQLSSGSTHINSSGLVDAIRAVDKGAPVRLIRTEVRRSPYEVYAQKSIKSFADLKNKTVMIGGVKDITRIYFEQVATANGLKPGDYDYIFAGATASRYAALASGSIAATIITSPFNFRAEAEGYTKLGSSVEASRGFPFSGYSTNLEWAKKNPKAIAGFFSAYAKGVDWLYDPVNRAEAVEIMVKASKAEAAEVDKTYDFFLGLKLWDRVGSIPDSRVQDVIDFLKKEGEIDGPTDLARYFDASLVPKPQ